MIITWGRYRKMWWIHQLLKFLKNVSVQEEFAVLEELPSDAESEASNNSDTSDGDYIENVGKGEYIS
ncbi:hypothetical protein TNCV_1745951 [Trichonephila clavipes]|nr:hypothetical protein TNCV_1745951 [Trichonephila clavipes]